MSRRDTIIVAVLVNAGLLIVLFASALKSNSPGDEYAVAPVPIVQALPEPTFKKEPPAMIGDEVDHALNQFAQNTIAASAPAPQEAQSSFADDLKAISTFEMPAPKEAQNPKVHTLMTPVVPQVQTASDFAEIKVKKGDVLEKIARHHHSTVAEIMKVNKLTNTNLRIGQVLKIPVRSINKAETSSISYSSQPVSANEDSSKFYTVKKGDNPWTIAVKNHLKVEDLLKMNNMNEDQARRLKPGDQIRIQ